MAAARTLAEKSPSVLAATKRLMRDAFYTDTPDWKGMVYGQTRTAVLQALNGLAST